MSTDYEFLVEKEKMWADMLTEVLKDNNIPCTSLPVYGAGLTLRAGAQERLKVYVPAECKAYAVELLNELFPNQD